MKKQQDFKIDDPRKSGIYALILATVSLFIIPLMGIAAVVMGVFGIYFGMKQKSGVVAILLNFVAILLGLFSYTLKLVVS